MFFTGCRTIEALKKLYKTLAMKWHPDLPGGDLETMKLVNAEYDKVFDKVKDLHEAKDGSTWEATGAKRTSEMSWMFRDILEKLIHMKGIGIEVCGTWLWISGRTWIYHTELGEMGCKYSKSKKAWYWTIGLGGKTPRSRYSMNDIRRAYGSIGIEMEEQAQIALGS